MQIPQIKKPSQEAPVIIVCVVLMILIVVFLVYPAYQVNRQKADTLSQAQGEVTTLKGLEQEVEAVIAKIKSSPEQMNTLAIAIPDKPLIPDLYAHLETLANSTNLKIDSIQSTDLTSTEKDNIGTVGAVGLASTEAPIPGTLGVVSVNLGLKGDVPSFVLFLDNLGRSMRIIDVQSVGITSADAQSGQTEFTFRLVLKAYYQKK